MPIWLTRANAQATVAVFIEVTLRTIESYLENISRNCRITVMVC